MKTSALPHPRFVLFLAVLLAVSGLGAVAVPPDQAVILGFDVAALVFIAASLPLWHNDHPDAARNRSARDDGSRLMLVLTAWSRPGEWCS